jgi:hypothetical protein
MRIILKTSPLNTKIPPKNTKIPPHFFPKKNKNPPKKYKKKTKNTKMAFLPLAFKDGLFKNSENLADN